MGSKDDHLHVPTQERMRSLAIVKSDAQRMQSKGSSAFELGRQGPWARMELTVDEVFHHFPTEIDRTAGQIGARCDNEAANTLTVNLAVEIFEGRRTVEDARRFYAETIAAYTLGRDAPYAERLQFEPPQGTADPDEVIIGNAMLDQTLEKLKDLVGAGKPRQ
jgi:hypothetical protein